MIRIPNSFSDKNQHQIVLHQPDRLQTDFERIEDLGADALRAARAALAGVTALPYAQFKPLQFHERVLRDALERRRIVGDGFREAVGNLLDAMAELTPDAETAGALACIGTDLRRARDLSNRVADLLAAERDIGFHRGILG